MIQQCILQQKQGSKSPADTMYMEFNDGKDIWVYTVNKQLILKSQMLPSDEVMHIKLSQMNPKFYIKWDDKPAYHDPQNETWKQIAKLIPYNQNVLVVDKIDHDGLHIYSDKGNSNLTVHRFDFINESAHHIEMVLVVKNMNRAMNIVNSMGKEQRKEVLYHFGYDPKEMKNSELYLRLIDPQNGVVLNRAKFDTKVIGGQQVGRSFLEYFVDRYMSQDDETTLKTLVLKALLIKKADQTNIIEKRSTGYYFIGENSIGQDLDSAVAYLKRNEKDLDFVKNQVAINDKLVEDDMPELLMVKGIKADDQKIIEQSTEELKENEHFQQQQYLLRTCREKFRMTVSDEESIAELKIRVERGTKTWNRLKFFKDAYKEVLDHPEWKFEKVEQVKNDAVNLKEANRLAKKKNKKYSMADV